MTCRTCAATLEVRLSQLPGVVKASVSYADASATIESPPGEPSQAAIRAAVEAAGFEVAGS